MGGHSSAHSCRRTHHWPTRFLPLVLLAAAVSSPPCTAQIPQFKLENPQDGIPFQDCGRSTDLDGDTLILSSSYGDLDRLGRAWIYRRNSTGQWAEEARLFCPDPQFSNRFGYSVAVSGDTAVVGTPEDTPGSGSVYIYTRTGANWPLRHRLRGRAGSDSFGGTVAIDGNTLLVRRAQSYPNSARRVDVFVREGDLWKLQDELAAPDGGSWAFGTSLALKGDIAVVGDSGVPGPAFESGAVYLFRRQDGDWDPVDRLRPGSDLREMRFGKAVDFAGDTIVVGTEYKGVFAFDQHDGRWSVRTDLLSPESGNGSTYESVAVDGDTIIVGDGLVAHVFSRTDEGWMRVTELDIGPATVHSTGGPTMALSGETLAVGQLGDDALGTNFGSVTVFEKSEGSWSPTAKLPAFDAQGDWYGVAVALDSTAALVGVYGDDDGGNESGSAYLYPRSGNRLGKPIKLQEDPPTGTDQFGVAVALEGDTALIGAHRESDRGQFAGAVYAFELRAGTWTQAEMIYADDAMPDANFGSAIALSGDTALIAAYPSPLEYYGYPLKPPPYSGTAYAFRRSAGEWDQQARLVPDSLPYRTGYGGAIGLAGNVAAIGAYADGTAAFEAGAVYVFVRSGETWQQQAVLTASDAAASDNFGFSVATDGEVIVVGAPGNNDGGSNAGSAYVFQLSHPLQDGLNPWVETHKLTASDPSAEGGFGVSVGIEGDCILIGAEAGRETQAGAGAAYLFMRSGDAWFQRAKLEANDAAPDDRFGFSLALAGGLALIGAPTNDDPELDSGAAYLIDLTQVGLRNAVRTWVGYP